MAEIPRSASAPKRASGAVKTWVDRTLNGLRSEANERNQLILGLRKQRMMRLKPNPPEAYQDYLGKGVRVPISFRLVETVVGAVAGNDGPQFFVSSPDQELTQRATTWARLMYDAQHRVGQSSLYYRYWDSLIADGMAAYKTVRRPWSDFPLRETSAEGEIESDEHYNDRVESFIRGRPPVPWKTRVVDPATFYPPRSEWGRAYAAESGLRPTEEVMRQLNLAQTSRGNFIYKTNDEPTPMNMSGLRSAPRIQVDELWTEEALFVRVGGNVFEYENDLGKLPYLWTSGAALAFSDPTLQAMSVLYPLQYLEPWVNQFLSTLIGNATLSTTPISVITHESVGTQGGAADVVISDPPYGKQVDLPPNSDMKFITPPVDQQSVALFNTMVQLAERFTLAPIPQFAGTRTPGVVLSAVAERILAVLKPRIDNAKFTHGELMKFYFSMVKDVVQMPVAVSGMVLEERSGRSRVADTVLTPRDISKISDVLIEIKYQTVQDRIAWDTHNVLMMQAGVWSKERTMRESNVRDTEAERQQIGLEQLLANPAIAMYIQTKALAGQPPIESLQELMTQAAQAGGEPGGGGGGLAELFGGGEGGEEATTPTGPGGGRIAGQARGAGGTGNGALPSGALR